LRVSLTLARSAQIEIARTRTPNKPFRILPFLYNGTRALMNNGVTTCLDAPVLSLVSGLCNAKHPETRVNIVVRGDKLFALSRYTGLVKNAKAIAAIR
jgi:hypothetical protein